MSFTLRRMASVSDPTVPESKFEKAKNHLSLRIKIGSQGHSSRPALNRSDSGDALEELVQCGICLERLSHPRMLPCQHTFCFSCLQTYVTSKNLKFVSIGGGSKNPKIQNDIKSLSCPLCQQKVDLPEGINSIQKLPKNLYTDSLLRVLNGKTSPKSPGTTLDYRCVNCQTVSSRQEQVCQHCIQIFCNVCWNIHLAELESKLTVVAEQLSDSEIRLRHKSENFDKRCDRLEEKIRDEARVRIEEIRRQEARALKEVESVKTEGHIAADILSDCIDKLKNQMEARQENKTVNNQKVTTYMNLHRETSKLLEQINFFAEARVTFNPERFTLEQCSEAVYNGDDEPSAELSNNSVANPFESVDSMAMHYKARSFTPKLMWKNCPRPAGMGVPPWDETRLYVTATDTHDVLILDMDKFKFIAKLSNKEMVCPIAITFSRQRKEIYVVDKWNQCVHVFSQDGDYLRNLCAQKLRSPEGIAMGPDEELWVCDTGNDKVIMIDPLTGEKLKTIGNHNGFTELNFPTSVAIYGSNLVVMDSGNNRVKTFNPNGDLISEFGYLGSNPGQFKSAEVVTVDHLGFIFVGDAGNARIQVFKPDGALVKIFGSRGGFGWVSGVLVTSKLDIIATDIRMRSLRIF